MCLFVDYRGKTNQLHLCRQQGLMFASEYLCFFVFFLRHLYTYKKNSLNGDGLCVKIYIGKKISFIILVSLIFCFVLMVTVSSFFVVLKYNKIKICDEYNFTLLFWLLSAVIRGNNGTYPDSTLLHVDEPDSGIVAGIAIAIASSIVLVVGVVRLLFYETYMRIVTKTCF